VRFAGPPHFAGVEMPAAERGVVRATRPRFTLGVVSDSFYEPSPDPGSMSSSAAPTLTTLTGFRVWNLAQGGSGYLNPGSDPLGRTFADLAGTSPYGSESRIEAVGRAPLDALLVNGSINDADFGVAEHRAAVDDFLTAVENQAPTLPIVVVGLEPISTARIPDGPTGKLAAMNENLRELAKQHRNVVGFIDPYTPNWFTGTGSTRNPTGEGNQDRYIGVDGVHPNGAGQAFYQRKVVAELARLPVDPLSRAR
jgi:lysophospholipase L1-like esterase